MKNHVVYAGIMAFGLWAFSGIAQAKNNSLGYIVSAVSMNQMTSALVQSGVLTVNDLNVAFPLDKWRVNFTDLIVTLNDMDQTMGLTMKIRVHLEFDVGGTYTDNQTYHLILRQQLNTNGTVDLCPDPLEPGTFSNIFLAYFASLGVDMQVSNHVRNALNGLIESRKMCVPVSSLTVMLPGIPQSLAATPMNMRIYSDHIAFSQEIVRRSLKRPDAPRIDYDGDGKADVSEWQAGSWIIDYAVNGFGSKQTILHNRPGVGVPGDYDGDGLTDIALRNPTPGATWWVDYAADGFGNIAVGYYSDWGNASSIPVPADYDGDGVTDLALFNNYSGAISGYVIDFSSNGFHGVDFNTWYQYLPSSDHPAPADYDGDGKADLSLKNDWGQWGIDYAANGFHGWDVIYSGYGGSNYIPAPADFDGDGKADLVVMHKASSGSGWGIDYSNNGLGAIDAWYNGHITYSYTKPMPSDYDGDGLADIAVKNDDGYWAIDYATDGFGSWNVVSGSWGNGSAQPFHKPAVEPEIQALANPFDFSFNLPRDSRVKVVAFSVGGKQIATLFDGNLKEGANSVGWSKADLVAKGLKRGIYLFTLRANGVMISKKVLFSE